PARPLGRRGGRGGGRARPPPPLLGRHRGAGGRARPPDRPPGVRSGDGDARLRGLGGVAGPHGRGHAPARGGGGHAAGRGALRPHGDARAPAPGAATALPPAHAAASDGHPRRDGGLMASAPRSTKAAEFLGLVSFALSLMVLISVATYNPADPVPFFKAGASSPVRNFIGSIGAFLAELLIPQLFGVAALLVPLVLGVTGWKLFWCRPIEAPYTKATGLATLLVSLTALLTLTFGMVTIEGEPVRAGGAAGQLAAAMLTASLNRTGAYIVLATSLFVSLILATQFSFATFLSGLGSFLAARAQAARTAWAHFRETRRKERMRREVIK